MIVEPTPNTNSVTISVGIKLAAIVSISFRSAPSRDYNSPFSTKLPGKENGGCYLKGWTPIVDVGVEASMEAQVQLIVQLIHGDTIMIHLAAVKRFRVLAS